MPDNGQCVRGQVPYSLRSGVVGKPRHFHFRRCGRRTASDGPVEPYRSRVFTAVIAFSRKVLKPVQVAARVAGLCALGARVGGAYSAAEPQKRPS
jgi:hypothetical protein